eukprot:TRINITY_DN16866_c0_g4_i1.p1 TRINITY_DN16866_c0_g4~~TRINITY_DN16866_c0_g4_i1.p1  ORF type:complete len:701 (+),score=195.02 TRINITY_DN16866_c0_g4_i1:120-2222(+)
MAEEQSRWLSSGFTNAPMDKPPQPLNASFSPFKTLSPTSRKEDVEGLTTTTMAQLAVDIAGLQRTFSKQHESKVTALLTMIAEAHLEVSTCGGVSPSFAAFRARLPLPVPEAEKEAAGQVPPAPPPPLIDGTALPPLSPSASLAVEAVVTEDDENTVVVAVKSELPLPPPQQQNGHIHCGVEFADVKTQVPTSCPSASPRRREDVVVSTATSKPRRISLVRDEDEYYQVINEELMHRADSASCKAIKEQRSERQILHWRERLQSLTNSPRFDVFFGCLIVANAAFMAAEVEAALTDKSNQLVVAFRPIDRTFTALFTIELLLRVVANGPLSLFCTGDDCVWSWFDLFIVVASIAEAFLQDTSGYKNVRMVRLLRMSKFVKFFRMVRIIRFVRALRTLVNSLIGTFKQVAWAFFLITCNVFAMAVIVGQAIAQHKRDLYGHEGGGELPERLDRYWGSIVRCMYTLFMSISNGVSWIDCADQLEIVDPLWVLLFIFYVASMQFVFLNVVTGVFCESAMEAARQDVELVVQSHLEQRTSYMEKVKSLFGSIDTDGSNEITLSEMRAHLDGEKARALFSSLDLEISDVWELFKLLDNDGTATIELEEFILGCLRLKGTAKALDVAKLSYDNKIFRKRVFKFMASVEKELGIEAKKRRQTTGSIVVPSTNEADRGGAREPEALRWSAADSAAGPIQARTSGPTLP